MMTYLPETMTVLMGLGAPSPTNRCTARSHGSTPTPAPPISTDIVASTPAIATITPALLVPVLLLAFTPAPASLLPLLHLLRM